MPCHLMLSFQILADLRSNGIDIYKFPEDDETVKEQNNLLNVSSIFIFQRRAVASDIPVSVMHSIRCRRKYGLRQERQQKRAGQAISVGRCGR